MAIFTLSVVAVGIRMEAAEAEERFALSPPQSLVQAAWEPLEDLEAQAIVGEDQGECDSISSITDTLVR